jgi:hypothetical protein
MTAGEFLEGLQARGVAASIEAGGLRFEPELSAEDEAFVRAHALDVARELRRPAPEPEPEPPSTRVELSAAETLDLILAEDEAANERAAAELTARLEADRRRAEERYNLDVMAEWSPEKVRALIEAGRLSASDVREWHAAREERLHRAAMALGCAMFSASTGRVARLIETVDGPAVVVR